MEKHYYTYIPAIKRNGALYGGVTSDLIKRVYQHRQNLAKARGITEKRTITSALDLVEGNVSKAA